MQSNFNPTRRTKARKGKGKERNVWVVSPGQHTGEDGRQRVHLFQLVVWWQRTELVAVVLEVTNVLVLHPPLLA